MDIDAENQKRATEKDALEHAWGWFALHARQRMFCVNFFLVAVAFLAAGYVTALTEKLCGLAAGTSLLGALIAWLFHRLDDRTRDLVHAGEDAMKPLQHALAEATGIAELELVKRVDRSGKKLTSYGDILWALHWTTLLAFVIGTVYALYLAGMRLCLVTPSG
jgi:hypothetical protein